MRLLFGKVTLWHRCGRKEKIKLKTRCVVAENNTQLKCVLSNSNSVCVCASVCICGVIEEPRTGGS